MLVKSWKSQNSQIVLNFQNCFRKLFLEFKKLFRSFPKLFGTRFLFSNDKTHVTAAVTVLRTVLSHWPASDITRAEPASDSAPRHQKGPGQRPTASKRAWPKAKGQRPTGQARSSTIKLRSASETARQSSLSDAYRANRRPPCAKCVERAVWTSHPASCSPITYHILSRLMTSASGNGGVPIGSCFLHSVLAASEALVWRPHVMQ